MMLPCKWITDQAGPLACQKGHHGYSWSICASGAECPGALPGPMTWPQTSATAQPGSSPPEQCVTGPAPRAASGGALQRALPDGRTTMVIPAPSHHPNQQRPAASSVGARARALGQGPPQ